MLVALSIHLHSSVEHVLELLRLVIRLCRSPSQETEKQRNAYSQGTDAADGSVQAAFGAEELDQLRSSAFLCQPQADCFRHIVYRVFPDLFLDSGLQDLLYLIGLLAFEPVCVSQLHELLRILHGVVSGLCFLCDPCDVPFGHLLHDLLCVLILWQLHSI